MESHAATIEPFVDFAWFFHILIIQEVQMVGGSLEQIQDFILKGPLSEIQVPDFVFWTRNWNVH